MKLFIIHLAILHSCWNTFIENLGILKSIFNADFILSSCEIQFSKTCWKNSRSGIWAGARKQDKCGTVYYAVRKIGLGSRCEYVCILRSSIITWRVIVDRALKTAAKNDVCSLYSTCTYTLSTCTIDRAAFGLIFCR